MSLKKHLFTGIIVLFALLSLVLSGCKLLDAYNEGDRAYRSHYNRGTDGRGRCLLKNGFNERCIDDLTRSECKAYEDSNWSAFHSVGETCN